MNERKQGRTQRAAAARAELSERTARRIEEGTLSPGNPVKRRWRTRTDPLEVLWENTVLPLLKVNPALLPSTLHEHLCEHASEQYNNTVRRTLQRRIKAWKAQHGPAKEVIFRQVKVPGRQGLSDFTELPEATITLAGAAFSHRLYHYRLAFSGWCYVKVICGGESFTALSTGLQNALWRCGGAPLEHRTDSLSAAWNNQVEKEALTVRYEALCHHYQLRPTRNNPGESHENGAIESPHGHLKRRITQALLLRGSIDFASLEEYQYFIDGIVSKINRRNQPRFDEEHGVLVSRSSTFVIKRTTYSVPSRFIGERLTVQLYDERLDLFHGHVLMLTLPRVFTTGAVRARCVNYRHVIESLVRKPQAFRYSALRDDLLPNEDYRLIWRYVDEHLSAHHACGYIVRLLHLAATADCEAVLGRYVLSQIERGELPTDIQCQQRFRADNKVVPLIAGKQHALSDYDQLLKPQQEAHHG